jgi:hypothetical protein
MPAGVAGVLEIIRPFGIDVTNGRLILSPAEANRLLYAFIAATRGFQPGHSGRRPPSPQDVSSNSRMSLPPNSRGWSASCFKRFRILQLPIHIYV